MDGSSPLSLLKTILPKVPFLIKTIIWHVLGLSSTSREWDLRTEVIVRLIRTLICDSKPSAVSEQQRLSIRAPPVRGPKWISRVTLCAPPEDEVRQLLFTAIDELKEDDSVAYEQPELVPVEAEWTGYRKNAWSTTPEPLISEEEKYARLMKEVSSDITILYVHGGALYLMDPATHRPATARHAQLTGGRVLSIRYRLAPMYPFPAALLDVLVSYLSLLSPGPDALHSPVPASKIVFAGDSAGGNLIFALLQLLLYLRRRNGNGNGNDIVPKVQFNGRSVPLDLPAGIIGHSPWLDLTQSMPSSTINAKWDYLPPPGTDGSHGADTFPACPLWPTSPPRSDLYAPAPLLVHPLASPLAALPESWTGAPPIWIGIGQEMLADEGACLAGWIAGNGSDSRDYRDCHSDGIDDLHSPVGFEDTGGTGCIVDNKHEGEGAGHHETTVRNHSLSPVVHLNQYAHMPHAFGLMLEHTRQSQHYMRSCAAFITACVNATSSSSSPPSSGVANKHNKHNPQSISTLSSRATYYDTHVRPIVQLDKTFDIFHTGTIPNPHPNDQRNASRKNHISYSGIFFSQGNGEKEEFYTYTAVQARMRDAVRRRERKLAVALARHRHHRDQRLYRCKCPLSRVLDGQIESESEQALVRDVDVHVDDKDYKHGQVEDEVEDEVYGKGAAVGMPRF